MDFKELLFLIYRMMPFIIVAFLVILSLFSGELSGFLLLIGIMVSSLITIGVSYIPNIKNKFNETQMIECSLLTLNNSVLSYLPLSTHTFAFIFCYFIYVIVTNKIVLNNWLLIAMITTLVFIDVLYNFKNCAKEYVLIPLIIGISTGVIWATIIGNKNQMIPKEDIASKCKVTKGLYKCKIKKTGQIVSA